MNGISFIIYRSNFDQEPRCLDLRWKVASSPKRLSSWSELLYVASKITQWDLKDRQVLWGWAEDMIKQVGNDPERPQEFRAQLDIAAIFMAKFRKNPEEIDCFTCGHCLKAYGICIDEIIFTDPEQDIIPLKRRRLNPKV